MDPLASPEDLATFLRQDVDTAAAEMYLAGASAAIRDYCRWEITAFTDEDVTLDSDGSTVILLPALQVTAINTVTLDGVVLDADGYTWSAMGALHKCHHTSTVNTWDHYDWPLFAGWPPGYRRLTVNYDGGFDPAPPELIMAACSIAARAMLPLGATQYEELVGGIRVNTQYRTVAQNMKLLGSEQLMIDRYRLPLVP